MTPPVRRRDGEGGFTLLETVAALAILSLTVVVVLQSVRHSTRLGAAAATEAQVLAVAEQVMESEVAGVAPPERWGNEIAWNVERTPVQNSEVADVIQVSVTAWKRTDRTRNVTLQTLIHEPSQ